MRRLVCSRNYTTARSARCPWLEDATRVMLRNIPNGYTQADLVNELNSKDFFGMLQTTSQRGAFWIAQKGVLPEYTGEFL